MMTQKALQLFDDTWIMSNAVSVQDGSVRGHVIMGYIHNRILYHDSK